MAKVGIYDVHKSGDGLWYIWYMGDKVSIGYESKRKARIDARGPTSTAKHPTQEEMDESENRKQAKIEFAIEDYDPLPLKTRSRVRQRL